MKTFPLPPLPLPRPATTLPRRRWLTLAGVSAAGCLLGLLLPPAAPAVRAQGAGGGKPVRIGVSIPTADHGWTGGVNYFAQETKKRLEATYPNVKIALVTASSASEQANGLEDLVATQKIDALVILPYESDPLTEPVRRLKDKGIFITVVDRGLTQPGIESLYVAGDNPGLGRTSAEYLLKALNGQGNIVVLRGIPTVVDTERFNAFMDKVKGTNVKVLDAKFANWNRDDGFKVMQDFLTRFPKINAVWAQDDDVALGVLDAIRQAKRDKEMFVVGGAGMKEMVKRVMDGDKQVPVDVLYPPGMIGTAMELTALRFVTQIPIPGRFVLASPLVTPQNAKDFYYPNSPF